MSQTQKAIVIGGGLGGMASALRLRAKGYAVTLLERGDSLGGRARVFKQDGHSFDAGPSVITAPYLIHELFELFQKNPRDYIDIVPLEHWYRYNFSDQTHFDYVANQEALLENIRDIEPKDVDGYLRLLAFSEAVFAKGFEELGDKPFSTIRGMLKHLPELMRIGFYKSVYKVVSDNLKSDKLRRVFTTQPLLVGGDPQKTTSIYLLILYLEHKFGCHFSMGGTHAMVNGLERLMREVGIEIQFNATVTAIKTQKKKVCSVEVNDNETLHCDIAVYNGDPAFAHHHLLKKSDRKHWPDIRLNRLKYSMGLCVLYFGTEQQYPDLPLHTISYGDAYKPLLNDVFHRHRYNDDLSLYLYRPTAMDASLAPEGADTFYALAPVPNLKSGMNWEQEAQPVRDRIVDLLESRLMPGLSSAITTEKMITPDYFQQDLLSKHGAGFSIQPIFTQSAYFRFHNQSQDVDGLYFVGAGTHPGAGIPGVLSSAKLIDRIIPGVAA